MRYSLRFGKRAVKDLKGIEKNMSRRLLEKIEALQFDLSGDVKKLSAHSPQYRLRVGDCRVLFDVENDSIMIQRILNRREAY